MSKRTFRQKPKHLKGTPYDSGFEKELHNGPLKNCEFHPEKIKYTIEKTYEPDFVHRTGDSVFYLESKGYFQDASELQKYRWVQKALQEGEYLVFIFQTPHKPIHFQKVRQDGTKMTHAEYAEKNGFMWFTKDTIERILK